MSDFITQEGFSYKFNPGACKECAGRCCTGESGYIYITKSEAEKICELLDLDMKSFVENYLYKKGYKYSIKENKVGDSYECVFYDNKTNGCKIYEARPIQCRTFPFWDYYKTRVEELKLECPGIIDDTNI